MKILVVQETDWLRNLPLQSHQIMEELSRRGHEIRVIDFPSRSKPEHRTKSLRSKSAFNIQRTGRGSSVRLIRPGTIMVPGVSRISSFLTQFKVIFEQVVGWCDVVVLYSVPTNGLQTLLSSRFASKPLIFHSFDVLHRLAEYDVLRCPTWVLERLVYSRADRIIVISESLRSYMKEIGIPESTIVLLPPAVNTDTFNPSVSGEKLRAEIGLSAQDQVILFSGWLYEFSGMDLVMHEMNRLLALFPQTKLVICGDGPLLPKLQLMNEQLGLQDFVRILGRRPYAEMPQVVAAADICVNPYLPGVTSSFAFPSKIAEYMAAGKPVVATDLPGTRSLLGEKSGVTLIGISQFVSALVNLLSIGNQRIELGKASRKYCEENFSLDSVTDKFESVLKDVLDGAHSAISARLDS